MFSVKKNMEKALNVAFDYLMSLDDKNFYEGLEEHANGDIAKALRELGAAEYEWELYLKKKQAKKLKKTRITRYRQVMIINKEENIVLLNKKIENVKNKHKYKNQVATMSSVPKTTGQSTPQYDIGMAA